MPYGSGSKPAPYTAPKAKSYGGGGSGEYKDRPIANMKPEQAQEALKPTEAEPVRLGKRMAGCV